MSTAVQAFPAIGSIAPAAGRHRRRWIVMLIVAGLFLAAGAVFLVERGRSGTRPAVSFRTARVVAGPLEARVTATGTLSALVTVQVPGRFGRVF